MIHYFYYFFLAPANGRYVHLELFIFMHFARIFFTSCYLCYLFFLLVRLRRTTCVRHSRPIISARVLPSGQVSSLSLKRVNPCRAFINYGGARNIFRRCRLLFYIMSRVVWSNLFEVLNWFPRHFLRMFARVPPWTGLNYGVDWPLSSYPGCRYNKGSSIGFISYIVLLCNNAIWAVWKTLCVPISQIS